MSNTNNPASEGLSTLVDPELAAKFENAKRKKLTINDFVSEFIQQFISPQTQKAYLKDLQTFFAFLKKGGQSPTHPGQIQSHHFQLYRDHLFERQLSPSTINRRLVAVRSFMKWCVAAKLIDHNPLDLIKLPKVTTQTPTKAFDDNEVIKMIQAPDPRTKKGLTHRLILLLLFNLGIRRAELTQIKLEDLYQDRGHKVLKIHGKGGKQRHIPLNSALVAEIQHYISQIQHKWGLKFTPKDFLFPSSKDTQKPIDGSTVFRIVERYARELGINKRVGPHSCRATAISHLLDTQQVPIRDVSIFAGHSNITTTERYDKRRKSLDKSAAYQIDYLEKKKAT